MQNLDTAGGGQAGGNNVAQVRFGVYNNPGNHAGKTIAEVRQGFTRLWGIPNDAHAYNGRERLDENYVIQPGDNVEFHRKAGEKG